MTTALEARNYELLHRALQIVAGLDDGARKRDHCGFNKDDTELGTALADCRSWKEWDEDDINEAARMVIYYQRQFRDELPEAIDAAKDTYRAPAEVEVEGGVSGDELEALNRREHVLGGMPADRVVARNDNGKPQVRAAAWEKTPLPPSNYEMGVDLAKSGEDRTVQVELDYTGAPLPPGVHRDPPDDRDPDEPEVPDYDYTDDDVSSIPSAITTEFLTGPAGTGKTFEIKRRIKENPRYGVLCATTGIAAVNLDSTTINSLLKYFDTESMQDSYLRGTLTRFLRMAIPSKGAIILDEISMCPKEQLDFLYKAASEAGINIVLTGDFCQLPPVKAEWAFKAECWPEFERNTTRLEKFWRQDNPKFLEAINLVRAGKGFEGVEVLKALPGMRFWNASDIQFQGTTILAKNLDVDRFNDTALGRVTGKDIRLTSKRWGKLRGEWKHIPELLRLKVGAYVMLLSNDFDEGYVNGDCGHIVDFEPNSRCFIVKLVRNQREVAVPEIIRNVEQKEKPDYASELEAEAPHYNEHHQPFFLQYRSKTSGKVLRERWVLGQVKYFPVRLAYAATVHKTQGLSLDRVQMDVRNAFFGSASMVYVALSRCRTPEGLRIVGAADVLAKRVKVDPQVVRWL